MTKYKICFNGHIYEMEIERLEEKEPVKVPMENVQVVPPIARTEDKLPKDGTVTSIMPGLVVKILCEEGQSVKAGQVVMILESMKMENEITSTKDGTVKHIFVSEGKTIRNGEALFEIA